MKIYYGTTAVAKMLGVCPKTVAAWFDAKQIVGHRLPSGARRMHIDDVKAFAQAKNIPIAISTIDEPSKELSAD